MLSYGKITILLLILLSFGCETDINSIQKDKSNTVYITGYAQGTTYSIQYVDSLQRDFSFSIDSLLIRFDSSLSIYKPNSIISQINQTDTFVTTDTLFIHCFKKAKEVWQNTEGYFDPTVAPLVNAFGFGFENIENVNDKLLDSLRQLVGFEKIQLINDSIFIKPQKVMLDFNALAQGYSVDVVAGFLNKKGIRNYLVEIGGELKASGKTEKGQYWRVGVEKPVENNDNHELSAVVELNNQALATSGNYRKFYEKDGVKYTHTIHPKTGKPVISNILSATVVAKNCIDADAYATAFMVMGLNNAKLFVSQQSNLEALLIYNENNKLKTWVSEGLTNQMEEISK
jgi:thiamine biosynthesis lipoprotein